VWPLITSTNFYLFGAAVILVFLLLLLNKNRNYQSIIFGLIWLILFLIPTFFSTTTIFVYHEHRLYFPIIGLLFLLNQTELFASIHKNILMIKRVAMCLVAVLFIYQIHNYIPVFNDALSFQKNALDGSPDDAYLNSTYGIVLANNQQPQQALPYLRKSLKLDSALKNVRLFIARYDFIPNKKYDSAKIFMLDEIKRTPKFADNYYALSTIGFETKDYKFCEKYLEKYVQLRRDNIPIQEFLASIYIQNKNFTKAKFLCDSLTKSGNPINPDFYKILMDSINAKK
jgi:tetratricopeptide (TPR) repeat protein